MTQTTAAVANSAAGVLTGKTAIVTGAPRSIGQAIAVALADKPGSVD
jgi:short-subunit dehydrogenase